MGIEKSDKQIKQLVDYIFLEIKWCVKQFVLT